jgi:hypothetical protein
MEQDAVIRELQVELMRLQEEVKRLELLLQTEIYYGQKSANDIERWRNIATMFYDRHENRRNCSLIGSCKECDAYEEAKRG